MNPTESEQLFDVLEKVMSGDIHVRRLYSFRSVMDRLVEQPDPKSYAPGRDRARPDKASDPSNQTSSLEPIFGTAAE